MTVSTFSFLGLYHYSKYPYYFLDKFLTYWTIFFSELYLQTHLQYRYPCLYRRERVLFEGICTGTFVFSTPLGNIVATNPYKIYHKQRGRTNCPRVRTQASVIDKKKWQCRWSRLISRDHGVCEFTRKSNWKAEKNARPFRYIYIIIMQVYIVQVIR